MRLCLTIYDCEICGHFHPWIWNGDCRENANRYASPEEYADKNNLRLEDIEVRTMDERVAADSGE